MPAEPYRDPELKKRFDRNFDSAMERVASGRNTVSTLLMNRVFNGRKDNHVFADGDQSKYASEKRQARTEFSTKLSKLAFKIGYMQDKQAFAGAATPSSIGVSLGYITKR